MIAVFGSASAFITVSLLLVGLLRREQQSATQIQSLRRWRARVPSPLDEPFADRVLLPTLSSLGRMIAGLLPPNLLAAIQRRLAMAGSPLTLNAFLITCLRSALSGPALYMALFFLTDTSFGMAQAVLLLALAAAGAVLPHVWLSLRIARRRDAIWKHLPDSFDLITTCVEAGLGLDAALSQVAEKVPGPFAEELDQALREIALGRPRREALQALAERTAVEEVIGFVNAIAQAEQMGTSIGPILRAQADQLRVRRRQRAEQNARRTPFKMLFPLVFCMFPALFVVAMGPAVITMYRLLSE
jgi:tight adherence protein C